LLLAWPFGHAGCGYVTAWAFFCLPAPQRDCLADNCTLHFSCFPFGRPQPPLAGPVLYGDFLGPLLSVSLIFLLMIPFSTLVALFLPFIVPTHPQFSPPPGPLFPLPCRFLDDFPFLILVAAFVRHRFFSFISSPETGLGFTIDSGVFSSLGPWVDGVPLPSPTAKPPTALLCSSLPCSPPQPRQYLRRWAWPFPPPLPSKIFPL